MQTGLLGMVPFDPMGQISDKNRQSEVRNGRCCPIRSALDFLTLHSSGSLTSPAATAIAHSSSTQLPYNPTAKLTAGQLQCLAEFLPKLPVSEVQLGA